MGHYNQYGPIFGAECDILIFDGCNNAGQSYTWLSTYKQTKDCTSEILVGCKAGEHFEINEYEVFEII